jgi:hypothetical protein
MRLWLDDIREMPNSFDVWAKTANEAIEHLKDGNVGFISFDHDLGEGAGTGYDVAVWIEEKAFRKEIGPMGWQIHSANTVGKIKIGMAMMNAEKYWRK